jgi:RNA polymerase sigma-70 factor (ECF subfamily)
MDMDGPDLIARAAAGDRDAFAAFVRRWERPLFRFLERMLNSADLAEEARQLTLLRVLERGRGFRGGSASTWLFQIAYRIGLDLRRRERYRKTEPLPADPLGPAGDDPAAAAAEGDERAFVRAALAAMEPEDRALLWLRVADERTFASVAATLEIPESTARLRLVRALGRLRRRLREPAQGNGGARWTATRS